MAYPSINTPNSSGNHRGSYLHRGIMLSSIKVALCVLFCMNFVIFTSITSAEQHFAISPRSTYVLEGESATLYCKVNNKSGVLYWEKDGAILTIETEVFRGTPNNVAVFGDTGMGEYHLQILNTRSSDAGVYVCKVAPTETGTANLTSDPATLWLSNFPDRDQKFPKCITSVVENLVENYTVDFTCVIYDSEAELRWQRMTTPLNDQSSGSEVHKSKNGYTMLIQKMTMSPSDHDAQYQCIYTSSGFSGSRSCSTGSLTVQHRPVLRVTPTLYSALPGENAQFTCHLDSAYPEPNGPPFIWSYKGNSIRRSENRYEFLVATNGDEVMTLNDLNGGDDGWTVGCSASNPVGLSKATAMIRVNLSDDNPIITKSKFLRWLIPISVLTTALLLAILIAIALFDCCYCCYRKRSRSQYDWSADNLAASTRRGSDISSLPADYYLTRQIRTSSRNDSRTTTPRPMNYPGSGQPVSPIPPSSTSPPPDPRLMTISRSPQDVPDGHLYRQRKTRGERDRNHIRREPMRRRNTGVKKNLVYADLDFSNNNGNGRISGNGLSADSGLDFATSSVDSRSVTPQERIVYARIVSNSSSPTDNRRLSSRRSGSITPGISPPPGTPGNREVTQEELADMLIHS